MSKIENLTYCQFRGRFETSPERSVLLVELNQFLKHLQSNYSNYRILVYGSFISEKTAPGDVDVMVYVCSTPTDPGFAKISELRKLTNEAVDVFALKLSSSFMPAEPIPDAAAMVQEFNAREAHIAKGIFCGDAIELLSSVDRP
jgi:predicted nucleotidyltransferase